MTFHIVDSTTKNIIRILLCTVFGFLISCNQPDHESTYTKYIYSYNIAGFKSISGIIADTIILKDIEGYEVRYTRSQFKKYYLWDSVFKPEIRVISLTCTDSTVEVTQSTSSQRFEFLENSPLITRKRIYFQNGKIKTIENLEYLNVNWGIWTRKRDSLVNWIDLNHTDLSGFIYDQSLIGAQKYMEAIKLYNQANGRMP